MTNHFRRLPLAGFIVCAVLLTGCDGQENQQQHAQAPQVSVHIVKSAPLAVTTELPGRTDAFRVAEVRPQVSGIILRRNFTEGSDVKAGDSLYQIDPATYQAAYDSAKGELAKAQAAANIAHLTVKRYLPLVGTQYVSKQEYDQAVATAQQADASVVAAKAGVESARINLAYDAAGYYQPAENAERPDSGRSVGRYAIGSWTAVECLHHRANSPEITGRVWPRDAQGEPGRLDGSPEGCRSH